MEGVETEGSERATVADGEVSSALHDIDEVTKQAKVSIPAHLVEREVSSQLRDISKNIVIKGFRAGKAPPQMVAKLHGDRVRMEVAQKLIADTLHKLVTEHKLRTIGTPEIEDLQLEPQKEIAFSAKIYLVPEPEISNFKGVEVKVAKRVVADKDVDEVLARLAESKATLRPLVFRNTVGAADVIEGPVTIALEGEEQPKAEPATFAMGSGAVPKEVEEALLGSEVGQTKVVAATLPPDHQVESLRGKKATYTVTVQKLSEKVLPELDDAFAKSLGISVETILELRLKVRTQLEEQHLRQQNDDAQVAVLDTLATAHTFKIPQPLIDDEIRSLLVRNGLLDPEKMDPARVSVEPFREKLGPVAEKRVRTAIIVDRVAKQEAITPADEEIEAALNDIAEKNQVPLAEVKQYFLRSDRAGSLSVELTRNKVLKFLTDQAKIEYQDGPAGT